MSKEEIYSFNKGALMEIIAMAAGSGWNIASSLDEQEMDLWDKKEADKEKILEYAIKIAKYKKEDE